MDTMKNRMNTRISCNTIIGDSKTIMFKILTIKIFSKKKERCWNKIRKVMVGGSSFRNKCYNYRTQNLMESLNRRLEMVPDGWE